MTATPDSNRRHDYLSRALAEARRRDLRRGARDARRVRGAVIRTGLKLLPLDGDEGGEGRAASLYDFSSRRTLTVPQQPPALSTTGKLVVRCSWSFRRACSTGSSAPQHADAGRMIVATGTSEARRSSAATPQHTSRSVTTPTSLTLSRFSTTGAQPQPELRMARAACAAVSCGVQHEDASIGFITSLQQLMVFLISRAGLARPFAPCAPSMLQSFTRVCAIQHMFAQGRNAPRPGFSVHPVHFGTCALNESAHPYERGRRALTAAVCRLVYFMMRFGCGTHRVHG